VLKEVPSRVLFREREFLALLKKLAALVTVLLLRFFSPAGPWSSLWRRKNPAPGGENRFSRGLAFSGWRLFREFVSIPGTVASVLSLGGLEEPLNILFSNPPCEEKLRRLFPASLIVSLEKDGGVAFNEVGLGAGARMRAALVSDVAAIGQERK